MKELYELKEKLLEELKGYGKKDMSAGSLDVIDKLAHATKNLGKVIEDCEEEEGYSSRYGGRSYEGRSNRGRSRDSRGRYSNNEGNSYYEGNSYRDEMRDGYYDKGR